MEICGRQDRFLPPSRQCLPASGSRGIGLPNQSSSAASRFFFSRHPYTNPGIDTILTEARRKFHHALLGSILTVNQQGVPSIADSSQRTSVNLARGIVERIGELQPKEKIAGQSSGMQFERLCAQFLEDTFLRLGHLRPGEWEITHVRGRKGPRVAQFEQYSHLLDLDQLAKANKALFAVLGNDYAISPDVVVLRHPLSDPAINQADQPVIDPARALGRYSPLRKANNEYPMLHASISCKWTIRSDRAQNARAEALNLIRNRKGRTPHIVVITAEPTPSRLSSLALGTGDMDCVYHFALPELIDSVKAEGNDEAESLLDALVTGKRLRDISDLPLDLAI